MKFIDFRARAREIFESIPEEYRRGVDGVEVTPKTVAHPTLPDVFTLGECLTDSYPSEFGGPGEVRSRVVLYYGSFLELARMREDWDWEEELWETVTHEVRHHLESLAQEDSLEQQDYAEDQNFLRRQGGAVDPFFFRYGTPQGPRLHEIDGDFFLEREIDAGQVGPGDPIEVRWRGELYRVARPEPLGDVHYVRLEGLEPGGRDPEGEVLLVLVRVRSAWEWLRGIFGGVQIQVEHSDAVPERVGGEMA